ncbi:uncharacterized protein LOC111628813 [Centruroides sculpturatus]|uniref:uncharacterized protein LOC111628807 n=1 Tax=Centruroides sculpturatus TaxID=218467 RepID=UPI000C6C9D52|nr:uncharacterized protein LOC111628807 [Centruroides sculpturatus]XP_023228421.1 uncharacterized protein LOC111628813 [Centruroides sculpturatus]
MFHSNQCYICKYCGQTVKLRQSMIRHLKEKHNEHESEWKKAGVINSMIITKKKGSELPSESKLLSEGDDSRGIKSSLSTYANQGGQKVTCNQIINKTVSSDVCEKSVPLNSEQSGDKNSGQIISSSCTADTEEPNNHVGEESLPNVYSNENEHITHSVDNCNDLDSENNLKKIQTVGNSVQKFKSMREECEVDLQTE